MKPRDEVLATLTKDKNRALTAGELFRVCKSFESAKDLSTMLSNMNKEGIISRTFAPPGGQSKFMYWNEPHGFALAESPTESPLTESSAISKAFERILSVHTAPVLKPELPTKEQTGSALTTQVAGSHYKDMKIQPVEYIMANNLGFCEGNIVKYVSRYQNKNGIEDLKKARHFLDILIEQQPTI